MSLEIIHECYRCRKEPDTCLCRLHLEELITYAQENPDINPSKIAEDYL
jgi:hypothetical protein